MQVGLLQLSPHKKNMFFCVARQMQHNYCRIGEEKNVCKIRTKNGMDDTQKQSKHLQLPINVTQISHRKLSYKTMDESGIHSYDVDSKMLAGEKILFRQ